MHRSGITFSCACVCGHGLILHLCNWMEDVFIHSLDVWNINVLPVVLSRLGEYIPMHTGVSDELHIFDLDTGSEV